MPDRLQDYLRQVGEQIRWKRARPRLLSELETHLLDQRDDCLSQGMTEEEAQQEAVRQMGDPVLIGQSLDAVHRPKPQWGLLAAALVLAGIGAALRLWLTNGWAEGGYAVADVLFLLCLGTAALMGTYLLDYTWLYRHGKGVSLAALALLWLVGLWTNGFPPFQYQWGMLLYVGRVYTFCMPLAFMLWLLPWRGRGGKSLVAAFLYLGAMLFGMVLSMQNGELIFVTFVCLALLLVLAWQDWFGWGKKRTMTAALIALGAFAVALVLLFTQNAYLHERFLVAFWPSRDPARRGFLGMALQQALQGAQWMGQGMWGGEHPYELTVAEAGRAYFLVTVATKLGWLAALGILGALAGLLVWLLVKCLRQKNQIGRLVALAVLGPMTLRLVLGGLVVLLGLPFWGSGVPLFFTSGGAVVDLALLGFVLSVFRHEALPVPGAPRPQTQ